MSQHFLSSRLFAALLSLRVRRRGPLRCDLGHNLAGFRGSAIGAFDGLNWAGCERTLKVATIRICIALVFSLAAHAAHAETLRIGTYVPEQSVGVQLVLKPWIESVKADLGDDITIREFWGGSLGRDPVAQFDLVKNGVLDAAWVLPGYTPGVFPQIQITELPYLAESALEASVAAWRLHEAGLIDGDDGVHVLGIWTTDVAALQMRTAINSLDEIRNLSIRTAGAVQASFIQAAGGVPQTLTAIETNEFMERRTIDGLIQAWTGMRTFRTEELTGAAYEAPVGLIPFLFLINRKTWEGLSPEMQAVLKSYGGETFARNAGKAYDKKAADIRGEIVSGGKHTLVVPPAEENSANLALYKQVHADWIANTAMGQEAYDLFSATLEELRAEP